MELNLINRKRLFKKIINNYFQMIFFQRPRLKTVAISLGYDCQCCCTHCSAAKLMNKERKKLVFDELVKAVNEAMKLGAIHFNITGGEPLLYEDTFDLMQYISRCKPSILSIATNGLLLDLNCAKNLRKVGVDVVQVSLDSPVERTHDQQRGFKGAYQKALEAVENAKNAGIVVFISTVATSKNLLNGEIVKLAHIAKKLNVILHLNLGCAVGNWSEGLFYLNPLVKKELGSLLRLHFVRQNTDAGYFGSGCKAGREKIYLTAYGDVLPCQFIQTHFGNIKNEPLAQIWKRMIQVPYFNNFSKECLASQNTEFISAYLKPLQKIQQLPSAFEPLKNDELSAKN